MDVVFKHNLVLYRNFILSTDIDTMRLLTKIKKDKIVLRSNIKKQKIRRKNFIKMSSKLKNEIKY